MCNLGGINTFIIIAGGKKEQLSFLHVYHHCCSLLMGNAILKISNNIEYISTVITISFVHIVTYIYYFISPVNKITNTKINEAVLILLKQCITTLQLLQLLFLIIKLIMIPYKCDNEPDTATSIGRYIGIFWFMTQFGLYMKYFKEQREKKLK